MGILSAVHLKKMKQPMKKGSSKRKQVLKKVFDYLMSDTFMFAPLCTSPFYGQYSFPGGINGEDKPLEGNDKKNLHLVTKIGDYLKADTYMYAPLLISQRDVLLSKGPEEEMDRKRSFDVIKGGTDEAGRKTVSVVSKDHNMDTMVTRTRLRRETLKHMIYQNC
ncbi:putative protein isoform X1 [Capsicum chacoense]|uniref:uncharacterized protein LOC107857585 isoform X1 n=1 Tax=Capsicum annuum TaxID=4072 RepID=UPI0007BEB01A|nr:uncharacterized protein LOC107857585 isoform X1 [Capsicum annuum]XP_016557886.1 uncharacterized protein LOC107857585 isoform X1 [Capsicum annuum]KAF3627504.1 putative leucine-rich repeat receptor-like protein kinase PXL1-like [Capsicum annuum]